MNKKKRKKKVNGVMGFNFVRNSFSVLVSHPHLASSWALENQQAMLRMTGINHPVVQMQVWMQKRLVLLYLMVKVQLQHP
jgi:hypothetical protein